MNILVKLIHITFFACFLAAKFGGLHLSKCKICTYYSGHTGFLSFLSIPVIIDN